MAVLISAVWSTVRMSTAMPALLELLLQQLSLVAVLRVGQDHERDLEVAVGRLDALDELLRLLEVVLREAGFAE